MSEVKSRGLGCLCPPRSSLLGSLNSHFHHRGSVQAQIPQIHLLNGLLHPKTQLPMEGTLKIQVLRGAPPHTDVSRLFMVGVSAPHQGVPAPYWGLVPLQPPGWGFGVQ